MALEGPSYVKPTEAIERGTTDAADSGGAEAVQEHIDAKWAVVQGFTKPRKRTGQRRDRLGQDSKEQEA